MALQTAEALILDVTDLHDRDRIVTFLTREYGKKRGVAQRARVKHSRFGGQLQPLAKVAGDLVREGGERPRRGSRRWSWCAPPTCCRPTSKGSCSCSYLADHLLEFAQEQEASDHLFRLLDSTLEALLAGVDRDLATRYFEAWVLRLAGVFPSPHACPVLRRTVRGGGGDPAAYRRDAALLRLRRPQSGCSISGATLDFLRRIGREALPAAAERPPGEARPAAGGGPLRPGAARLPPARVAQLRRDPQDAGAPELIVSSAQSFR